MCIRDRSGTQGYVINAAGSFDDFGLSNPTALLTANVTQTSLPANSAPVSISSISLSAAGLTVFVPSQNNATIAAPVSYTHPRCV